MSDIREGGLKGSATETGKVITGDENYQLGDLAKKAAKVVKEGATGLYHKLHGDEVGDEMKKAAEAVKKETAKLGEVAAKYSEKLKEKAKEGVAAWRGNK
eukprot:1179176-Prorocentrum_minimum.AAC.3